MSLQAMVRLARPSNWIKNVVVIMPVLFGLQMGCAGAWINSAVAALSFCFASAFAYILNDIRDVEADRTHPVKKNRPIAAGEISVKVAMVEGFVFLVLSLGAAAALSKLMLLMVSIYILLQLCYTFFLKHKVLVDVICIALGFVLRAASGAVAITVAISPWLFICIFTICLFMGFCKRYNEVVTIGDMTQAHNHRKTLIEYTPDLLTHLITISAGIAIVAFLFYGLSESTVKSFGTNFFVYTLPVVVYAVFRFAMLSMKGVYADPTDIILNDRPFQLTVVLWIFLAVVIIVYGSRISDYLLNLY